MNLLTRSGWAALFMLMGGLILIYLYVTGY